MIIVTKENAVTRLTIERPEKANSLTKDMLADLAQAVLSAHKDSKLLVISGTGKVFSAGADLEAAKAGLALDPVWEELSKAVASFPGLSIAALNGTVAGGAMGMVLACDLRIAVPGAKFFYPVMQLGFLPQPSDPKRMRALIGPARTKQIFMAGEKISAQTAFDWGLVDKIVDSDLLSVAVTEMAQDVVKAEKSHAAAIKSLIDDAF